MDTTTEIEQPAIDPVEVDPDQFAADYKAARNTENSPQKAAPVAEEKKDVANNTEVEVTSTPESSEQAVKASESAPVSETGSTQEHKSRDRDAEGRIKSLTADKKRLEQELQEFRTRKPAIETAEQKPIPAQQPVDPSDPEPKDTEEAFQGENGYTKYLRAAARWDIRQEQRQQEQVKQQQIEVQAIQGKIASARQKYSDFDAIAFPVDMTPSLKEFFREFDAGSDVIYELGKNSSEYARISQLSPAKQIAEFTRIADRLTAPPAQEPPKPQISRVPAPLRPLGGGNAPATQNLSDIKDADEYARAYKRAKRA